MEQEEKVGHQSGRAKDWGARVEKKVGPKEAGQSAKRSGPMQFAVGH